MYIYIFIYLYSPFWGQQNIRMSNTHHQPSPIGGSKKNLVLFCPGTGQHKTLFAHPSQI